MTDKHICFREPLNRVQNKSLSRMPFVAFDFFTVAWFVIPYEFDCSGKRVGDAGETTSQPAIGAGYLNTKDRFTAVAVKKWTATDVSPFEGHKFKLLVAGPHSNRSAVPEENEDQQHSAKSEEDKYGDADHVFGHEFSSPFVQPKLYRDYRQSEGIR